MIGADICSDWALHSSFVPHNDLVTSLMNRRFTVNLLDEPIESVSTTASSILPSFHHTTVGFGLPKINNNAVRATVEIVDRWEDRERVFTPGDLTGQVEVVTFQKGTSHSFHLSSLSVVYRRFGWFFWRKEREKKKENASSLCLLQLRTVDIIEAIIIPRFRD